MVGDESALPAIAASLEAVPNGAKVVVRLVCDGPDHEIELPSPGDLDLRWLHRTGAADDVDLLADAVSDLEFPAGRVHAFVHGEARRSGPSAATCSPTAASTGATCPARPTGAAP